MVEIWKDVLGYEGKYMVSNLGRVKSIIRRGVVKDTFFTPWKNHNGYYLVSLRKDGKKTGKTVSILVWEAFNGPVPKGMEVNHINEDKSDNRLVNLNLLTPSQNCRWGTRGRRIAKKIRKPVTLILPDGTEFFTYFSASDAERALGIPAAHASISACCLGKIKKAYGYRWKFALPD